MSAPREDTALAAQPVLIDARALTKRYGDLEACHGVDVRVPAGQIVGLLGANGAGKTTLIRVILGLERADGGSVTVFGKPPGPHARASLGYVPQGLGLYQGLSVEENAEFVAQAFRVPLPPLPPGLASQARTLVADLGLGHRRLLAFHCALLHSPRLLVLDEPTSGVDPLTRARLWDAIHDAADAGTGVLVTTHYMQEAEQCDHLVVMSHGRVYARGSATDITAGRRAVVLDTPRWQELFTALDEAGVPLTLDGTLIRVPDAVAPRALAVAGAAGLEVAAHQAPATLEEVMVAQERAAATASGNAGPDEARADG